MTVWASGKRMRTWAAKRAQSLRLWPVMLVGSLLASTAFAEIINIESITAAPGAKDKDGNDFVPNSRLTLVTGNVGAATTTIPIINIADCEAIKAAQSPRIRITWDWVDKPMLLSLPQYGIKLASPGSSCDGTSMVSTQTDSTSVPPCQILFENQNFLNPSNALGETTDFDLNNIIGTNITCASNQNVNATAYFLVNNTATGTTTTSVTNVTLQFQIDLLRPTAPTISSITSGNQNLKVSWTQVDTTLSARVYWSDKPFSPNDLSKVTGYSGVLTGTSYQITGLNNGQPYYVSVVAVNATSANESAGSPLQSASPIETQDLWQYYKTKGGQEQGGYAPCNAAPVGRAPGAMALLLLTGLAAVTMGRRRLTKRKAIVALTGLALVLPGLAMAKESPLTSSLDLRFGSYSPAIDSEFAGKGASPYGKIMHDGTWEFGLNMTWRIWEDYGDLSAGFGAGYWSKDGNALTLAGVSSADTTTLSMVPLSIDVVYRYDVLAKRYKFPLIPYAKAGLVYGLWWMENGLGNLSRYTAADGTSSKGMGGTGGVQGTIGIRLLLDVFEPQAASSFDIEMGVNHSYLFAEMRALSLNDFGSKKSIDLSANIFYMGLAFDL